MKPSEINALLEHAKAIGEKSPQGIHTFSLYWITWEAYRTRMLAVAARLRGWRIDDAYFAIGARRISSQKGYQQYFKAATEVELSQQSGLLGRVWKNIDVIEVLRHRLVHGYRSANPDLISHANRFVDAVLTNQEDVFGTLLIPLQDGSTVSLGNVLAKRPAAGRNLPIQKDCQSLMRCFGLGVTATPGKLPDLSITQTLTKIVEELS